MFLQDEISTLKTEMEQMIGQKIVVRGKSGKKEFRENAVLEKTYAQYFLVRYEQNEINGTYRYTDVLSNDLEVSIYDGKEYSPLIPTFNK